MNAINQRVLAAIGACLFALYGYAAMAQEPWEPVESIPRTCQMNPGLCDYPSARDSTDNRRAPAKPISRQEKKALGILGDCLFGGDCSRMNEPL